MAFWEAIVLIVLIGSAASVLDGYFKTRRTAARHSTQDSEALRAQDEVRELKARIQVLERVITDTHGSNTLDAEIERLRDR